MTGVLLVDKPEGVSSAGVIRQLKPLLGRTKVGHLGTLDPFASGLLPLCLGEATKVARYLLAEDKAYTGVIRLGSATDTLDRTGATLETAAVPALDEARVAEVAARFVGPQRQVPPMYSALKRRGVPLYKLARRGVEVEREPRDVVVTAFELALAGADRLRFAVTCSKGTYVRALAADVGRALGTVAHLDGLRRTRVGRFDVANAATPATLQALPAGASLPLLRVRDALADYRSFGATADVLIRLRHGQQDALAVVPPPSRPDETALIIDTNGEVAAVIEAAGATPWRLVRLLAV